MFVLAAATVSTLDKLKTIPPKFWIGIGAVVLCIVAVVVIMRLLAGTNKLILFIVSALVLALVFFNWVYKRSEPKFLTPVVNKIAPFFPSQIDYAGKQQKGTH